ncbi:YfiR family protein [Colwellia piezophila]|uniref:YfiR family protein n=1 Tax=Colwellia piezophila TaxID=211668 RepID=UPI00037BC590|nr:YfiR family protein [Colwellia piezophila]
MFIFHHYQSRVVNHFAVLVLLILCLFCQRVVAQDNNYQIKAAYLYQFSNFVKWQVLKDEFVIGIVSDADIIGEFEVIEGKKIKGKPVRFIAIHQLEQLDDCCSLVFVAIDKKAQLHSFLAKLRNKPVLTVLDHQYPKNSNGMIQFVRSGTKLKFTVNNTLAKNHGINFSAFLLQVAKDVY